jgi:hypothetical protein
MKKAPEILFSGKAKLKSWRDFLSKPQDLQLDKELFDYPELPAIETIPLEDYYNNEYSNAGINPSYEAAADYEIPIENIGLSQNAYVLFILKRPPWETAYVLDSVTFRDFDCRQFASFPFPDHNDIEKVEFHSNEWSAVFEDANKAVDKIHNLCYNKNGSLFEEVDRQIKDNVFPEGYADPGSQYWKDVDEEIDRGNLPDMGEVEDRLSSIGVDIVALIFLLNWIKSRFPKRRPGSAEAPEIDLGGQVPFDESEIPPEAQSAIGALETIIASKYYEYDSLYSAYGEYLPPDSANKQNDWYSKAYNFLDRVENYLETADYLLENAEKILEKISELPEIAADIIENISDHIENVLGAIENFDPMKILENFPGALMDLLMNIPFVRQLLIIKETLAVQITGLIAAIGSLKLPTSLKTAIKLIRQLKTILSIFKDIADTAMEFKTLGDLLKSTPDYLKGQALGFADKATGGAVSTGISAANQVQSTIDGVTQAGRNASQALPGIRSGETSLPESAGGNIFGVTGIVPGPINV